MRSAGERIAEMKRTTEELERLSGMIRKYTRIIEEEKYAKAEHDGKECKDR